MVKVALYARVSKAGEQSNENQLKLLRDWARNTGNESNVIEFEEEVSSRDTRPKKEEVLRLLRTGEVGTVVFYSLDRWGRSMPELVNEFEEARRSGWKLVSLKEGLSFDTAGGQLYAHILASFAAFERERIRERTIAGLNRVRAQGKRLGRPKGSLGKKKKPPL